MPKSTTIVHQISWRHHKRTRWKLTARPNHLTKSACKCSSSRVTGPRGCPVVTAFQDLCLGAPIVWRAILLPLECVEGDATKTQNKKDGTGRNRESRGSLSQKVTSLCCQGNPVSSGHTETLAIRAIRPLRKYRLHRSTGKIYFLYNSYSNNLHSIKSKIIWFLWQLK